MNNNILHIYSRGLASGTGGSLEVQQKSGIKKAQALKMGYKLWTEEGISTKDDLITRPVLRDILTELERGEIMHLFVRDVNQISTNEDLWIYIKYQYLLKTRVVLHTPSGEFKFNDATTKKIMGILSCISNYDNDLRTIRLTEGKIKKISDGFWRGGQPPYGYKLENSKLVIDQNEAKWVVLIHEMYRDNNTASEIRRELLRNGVLTRRGNPVWSDGSLTALLNNTQYDGYWYFTPKKAEKQIRIDCPRICEPHLIQAVSDARIK
jgi:site-specific DNA recombinase|tara:strand:- start:882 stop:1676 length:795 start_codon:yes stop_codon:yes gene_type:complete